MPPSPSKVRTSRQSAERDGQRGETLAALFLQAKFYRILDRRYKTPIGEIDLVAQRGDTVVFVEVKTRANVSGETEALEAVNISRIARAAEHWLARHPQAREKTCRFDVIFLAPKSWPRHLINAFES